MNNFLVQSKINGSVSFRQQTIKMNDENITRINCNGNNNNKALINNADENLREFGKDLTNLTYTNQENIPPNLRKFSDIGAKDNKLVTSFFQKKVGKEDLTNRFKNQNARARINHSKTLNESTAIANTKRKTNSSSVNNSILTTSSNINTQGEEKMITKPSKLNISNVLITNEKMSDPIDEQMQTDTDVLMEDSHLTLQPLSVKIIEKSISHNVPEAIFNSRPQLCEDYIPDIFQHLKEIEFDHLPKAGYMKKQIDINEKMRGILIDWLVEVHLKFKLIPETLFLTVNLIDRYLEVKQIIRNKLQLIGVTAMLIACKYEEIYAPEVRDFVYITDKAYTKEEILQMENEMLSILEYNITVPSPMRYLEIYNYYLNLEESPLMFCRYLLEHFLMDYKMLKYNPSLLASSTVYITLKITKKNELDKIFDVTGYSEEKLRECSKDICVILDNIEKNSLQAIKKKFSLPKYLEVAKIKFN